MTLALAACMASMPVSSPITLPDGPTEIAQHITIAGSDLDDSRAPLQSNRLHNQSGYVCCAFTEGNIDPAIQDWAGACLRHRRTREHKQ